jgi:transcriptional regulator with XRE-family HTH domain
VSSTIALPVIGVISFHRQAKFPSMLYFRTVNSNLAPSRIDLASLRARSGLSVRELARQLETSHTNIINWEKSGRVTKTEFIAPLAALLGVTPEELLGLPKSRLGPPAGGKLGQLFEAAAKLPRSKQEKVIALLEAFVDQHQATAS